MTEEALFCLALEQPTSLRPAFLAKLCEGNPTLLDRVNQLLAERQESLGNDWKDSLDPSITVDAVPQAAGRAPVDGPGSLIGPYKLLQQIGEGGMGAVYMAEQQQPIRRKVALKIIKPGMDSKQVLARFEAERQALAMMDHLNIARVLDAGMTETGRPFFVMELVHGVPITRFCDDNKLTPSQRLGLFIPICMAIQHAHQKGVIHRDIKPSNVLVTMYDDKPVPKVIDFGVAKAIEQRLTEKTLFTQFGAMVGTFEYMSPEQAEMNAFGVDTRSDIYSLGVLLYELLTGTTPLDRKRVHDMAYNELVRLIKEEEPLRPSARLSSSDTLVKIAASRSMEPQQLSKLVRGEIDWIVMKCLEKDRTRRYETANGLARDVQRYLADEPVEACPPSFGYRIKKAIRRNKGLLTTVSAFALLLIAGSVLSIRLALRSDEAAQKAEVSEAAARQDRDRADAARNAAEADRKKVAAADRENRELLSKQYVRHGMQLVEEGNYGDALVWYAAALQKEAPSGDREDVHQLRIAATAQLCPRPRAVIGFSDFDAYASVTSLLLSPDGAKIFAHERNTDGSFQTRLWNAQTGAPLTSRMTTPSEFAYSRSFWTPDSQRIITWEFDRFSVRGQVQIWDANTGKMIAEPIQTDFAGTTQWKGPSYWDTKKPTIMSRDGKRIIITRKIGEAQFEIRVWDTVTGKQLASPIRPAPGECGIELSPDGRRVITFVLAGKDWRDGGNGQLWDVETGKPVPDFPSLLGRECFIAPHFSSTGRWVVTTAMLKHPDGMKRHPFATRLWNAETGKAQGEPIQLELFFKRPTVKFSPDDRVMGFQCFNDNHLLYDPMTGKRIAEIAESDMGRESSTFAYSPDSSLLLTASFNRFRIWNARTGQALTAFIPFEGTMVSHAFSPDNRRLLISSKMGAFENVNATRSVQIWDLQTGNPITTLMRHHDQPTSGYLSPDGGQLVTVAGSEVRLWDAVNGKPLSPLLPHNLPVDSVEFTSDNERILTRDRSGTIRIWDVLSSIPAAVRFHPDGWIRDTILNREGTVALIKTWADCERKPGTAFGIAQATGAEADVEVYCKWSIRLWDTRTGQPISELIGSGREGSEPAGAFNQEGDRAVIWNNKQVHFWDVARRQRIGNVIVVEHPVVGARVCPDGRSILILFEESDSAKKTTTRARLWDGPKGEPLSEPFGLPSGSFFSPRFCCQGKRILLADIYQNGKNGEALLVDDSGKSVAGPFGLKSFVFDHDLQKSMELDEKNQISVRNLTTGAIIDKPISFDMPVLSYWFDQHRDALCVLSGTNQPGSTWKLWNSRSGVVEIQSADHSNRPLGYLQSSTGQLFLDSQNRTIRVRQSSDGQLRGLLMEHPKPVTQAAVFGPNNLLLSVCGDFNFRGGMYVKTRTQTSLPSDRQQLGGSFFSPLLTREYSFTGINDHRWDVGQLRVWDGNTGELIVPPLHRVTEGLGDWRYCSEMSEDGSRLLRCLDPNTVETWELPRDRKSGGQWMEVAEVLSGRKFDQSGSLTNLPSGAWQKLCESHPEVTALPERNWIDWHQSQADRSADQYDWRAAKLHLDRLSEIAPFDRKRSLHRARCYYQLDLPVLGNQAFLEAAAIPPQHLAQRNSVVLYQDAYGSRLAGYWLKKSGKLKESTAAYHEAIAAIEELLGRSPLALDYRNDLVTFTKEFGEHLLELKSYSEADELYQKITARLEKLTRDFPEEETCKFDLAQYYRACGVTNEKAGRMKIAIEFADKGLATLQPFLKRTPLSEKYKSLACNTHWGRAVALDSLERYSEAADAWNETLKFSAPPQANNLSWLCAISRVRSGDHARATQDVESLISGSPLTANDFFNAACVFAVASSKAGDDGKLKARYASRALELLNKAKDKGQFQEKAQVDELKTDTDLEAIRSLDEYKKLLKEVEK